MGSESGQAPSPRRRECFVFEFRVANCIAVLMFFYLDIVPSRLYILRHVVSGKEVGGGGVPQLLS